MTRSLIALALGTTLLHHTLGPHAPHPAALHAERRTENGAAMRHDTTGTPMPPRTLPALLVDPGPLDRPETIVSFQLPPTITGDALLLRGPDDKTIPLQIGRDRRAWFIARSLAANTPIRYRLEPSLDLPERVLPADAHVEDEDVVLRVWEQTVLRYRTDKDALPHPAIDPIYKRAGYIHPLRTPTGRIVTDDYPPDHIHHHGIWSAWTKTVFQDRKPDFWNMGDGTGTVEFESLLDTWSGRVQTGLRTRHRFVDLTAPTPTTVLLDVWELFLYAAGQGRHPYRIFDLVSTQELVGPTPLVLTTHHYGGLGFRGPRAWDGAAHTQFLTSEGLTRSNGHATRARWCYIGGQVDDAQAGVAILGHPDNFRAPQPMRIHPTEPFFNWAPTQLGEMVLTPGTPYTSRYRFIVFDGPPDATLLDRLWQDYATPVTARLSP